MLFSHNATNQIVMMNIKLMIIEEGKKMHDFFKTASCDESEETAKKKKIASLYFNYCWAFFLLALVVYMVADHSKTPKEEAAFQHETIPQVISGTSDLKTYEG